jgi:hypothetical protein
MRRPSGQEGAPGANVVLTLASPGARVSRARFPSPPWMAGRKACQTQFAGLLIGARTRAERKSLLEENSDG